MPIQMQNYAKELEYKSFRLLKFVSYREEVQIRGKKSFLGLSLYVLMRYKKGLYSTMNVKSEIYGIPFRKTI